MSQNLTFNLNVDTNAAVSSINQFFSTFDQGAAQASSKLRSAFNEPIKTEVEIVLKNGELVAKKIEQSNSNTKKLKDTFKALNGEVGKTPNALRQQMKILESLRGSTKKYKDGTRRLTKEWKMVEDRIRQVKAEQDRLSNSGGGMDNLIGKFALVQTLANLATSAILNLTNQIKELASTGVRMEMLMLQLEAFTGGADQAKAAYEEFANIARATPFNVEQIANAGKIMMAFGVDTETATEMTRRLAVAAAATGGDVNNLGRNLGQISAQGQAYTRDLHQFAMQGLPIWEEMSMVTGRSVSELKKLASEGKISFDIVSAAIKNMTAEGTAFDEVSKRMQETFAGRLAAMETAANNLSLGMVQAFNEMDQAMGGIITGAMKGFTEALENIAKQLPAIGKAVGQTFSDIGSIFSFVGDIFGTVFEFMGGVRDLITEVVVRATGLKAPFDALKGALDGLNIPLEIAGGLIAAMAGPAVLVGIGLVVKGIYGMMTATYAYIKAQIMSLGLSGPAGWATLAAAAGVTAGAYLLLRDNLNEANAEMEKNNQTQKESVQAATEAADGQGKIKVAIDDTTDALKQQADQLKINADKAKQQYQDAKKESDALKESILLRIEDEKNAVQELIDQKKDSIQEEKDAYKALKEETKQRYDDELARVREIYDLRLEAINAERDALSERGPKEQELYELRKQELQQKLDSADLSKKERLEIEARLERMGRQEKMEELSKRRKETQLKKEQEIKQIEDEKEKTMKEQEKLHDKKLGKMGTELEQLEGIKSKLEEQKEAVNRVVQSTQVYNGDLQTGINRLGVQISRTNELKKKWEDVARAAREANTAAKQQKTNSRSGSGTPSTSNFAGGPIAAGTTSWVNELGKEAFLSASGRLSMINDTHGKWTAPTDGTIIPAHLTSQLSIPTGGINLNKAASSNASRAGSGGMASMVRAIQGSMSGDTFNQSVTVQAANPVQAANNMMVEMTRLKRRRMGR